jgi:hypothetical protein
MAEAHRHVECPQKDSLSANSPSRSVERINNEDPLKPLGG